MDWNSQGGVLSHTEGTWLYLAGVLDNNADQSSLSCCDAILQVPSSSAGSDDLDKVSNTVQKFKEKNRAAQRRYRERQKVFDCA